MEQSIKNGFWKGRSRTNSFFLPFFFVGIFSFYLVAQTFIDQAVAVVGKQVITFRDLRLYHLIDFVLDRNSFPAKTIDTMNIHEIEPYIQRLVHTTLINHYLQSIGLYLQVSQDRLEKIKHVWKLTLTSSDELRKYCATHEVSDSVVEEIFKKRIRSELFMEQHLPIRITVTQQEVEAYYEIEKFKRFLGKPFQEVEKIVREEVRRDKLKKEFNKWLENEIRRTEVVFLPLQRDEK